MKNIFAGIGSGIVKAAEDFKSAIVKVAGEAPGVLSTVEADAPEVVALASLAYPQAGTVATGGLALLEEVASVLHQGGTAAESNFLNAGMDQQTINGIKSLIPAFQKFAASPTGGK